ncbi:MAG: CocE/NonD family hydrolase [Acidobacteria bacterium]|nr:CocE/NonD family hydrolase [Acidobacteriota bacterium]
MIRRLPVPAICVLLVLSLAWTDSGLTVDAIQSEASNYELERVMIPMRDGIKLNTHIFRPRSQSADLPIMLERTPYQVPAGEAWASGKFKALAADGYIFVFQDIRGRYGSEGQFVMQRAPVSVLRPTSNPETVDEVTDAYDTIEWLVRNVPRNNGRVGIIGISYPGWTAGMATLAPHSALKAASPQASPTDMFIGDDFHHHGAFRLSYGFEYATRMETNKEQARFNFDLFDTYEWYLRLGALRNVNEKYLHGKIPTWNDFVEHPDYDQFWQEQAMAGYLRSVKVPMLIVAGWWDQEDFYGPLNMYETLEKYDRQGQNFFVAGPWNHGGWARGEGDHLGRIQFGSSTARYYREKIEAPWFAYYLKDQGEPPLREATTFQTGSNEWKSYDQWPPAGQTTARRLYLHRDGQLSFDAPTGDGAEFDQYVSDPARPVPYRPRPIEPTYNPSDLGGSGWSTWLVDDQRFVDGRPDVLSWSTKPLVNDIVLSGRVMANLFAATSGSDSDWVVKLIDVYPGVYPVEPRMSGYQLMVASDVFRGRYRQSFSTPKAVTPNKIEAYQIDLHQLNHRFRKGHRIMVQIQSTWFPVIDRNPQLYVDNIFKARDSDYIRARQRIFRSKRFPTHLVVPVGH